MLETVVITGISGSGKSTLAGALAAGYPDKFVHLKGDNYFRPIDQYARGADGRIDWDNPRNLIWSRFRRDILSLRANSPTLTPVFDFKANEHPDPFDPGITIAGARTGYKLIEPQGRTILVDFHQALMLPKTLVDKALLIMVSDAEALRRRQIVHPFITEEYFVNNILRAYKETTLAMVGKHLHHLYWINGMQPMEKVVEEAYRILLQSN